MVYIVVAISLVLIVLIRPAVLWLLFERLFKNSGEKRYFSLYKAMYEIISKRIYKAFAVNISESNSWEKLMNNVATVLMESFGGDGYSVLLTPENKEWHFVAWPSIYDKDDLAKIARKLQKEGHSNIHKVIEARKVVVIENTRRYEKWQRIGKAANLNSWIGIPLISNGKVIGVLSIDFMEKYKVSKWKRVVAEMLISDIETINRAYQELLELIYEPNIDPITKNFNKNALKIDVKRYSKSHKRLGIVYIKISNFDKLLKVYGNSVMIEAVKKSIDKLKKIVEDKGRIYSISLKELAILVPNPIPGFLISLEKRVSTEFLRVVDVEKDFRKIFIKLDVKVGIASYPEDVQDPKELLQAAVENAENKI